jgi:hypothetical protein
VDAEEVMTMTDTVTLDDRYTTGLLVPDTLLPSQFFASLHQKSRMDGERRLMVAVLEDALNCFQKHVEATDPKARQLFLDAEEWIMSADQSWFFSFVNVCETLGLDPEYVREGLLKWRDKQGTARNDVRRVPEAHADDAPLKRMSSG